MTTITFAIAAYNAAPFIEAAVSSVLSQSIESIEAIVVDDASTDATCEIVARLAARDARVRLLRNPGNLGPAAARNAALAMARGAWFAVVDADDFIFSDRSANLLDLAGASGADIIADNLQRFEDGSDRMLCLAFEAGAQRYCFEIDAAEYLRLNTMYSPRVPLGYLKPMFRTSFLRGSGLSYRDDLRIGEDFDLCLRCLLNGARYLVTSEPMYMYRVRDGSLSWRLDAGAVEKLINAYMDAISTNAHVSGLSRRAGEKYVAALRRAYAFESLVGSLKAGRWRAASLELLTRIDLLPLLMRSSFAHFYEASVQGSATTRRSIE